ncbi:hypothetical protein PTKIN_Ptkin04bG0099000 [Pterospermum kingtungense]
MREADFSSFVHGCISSCYCLQKSVPFCAVIISLIICFLRNAQDWVQTDTYKAAIMQHQSFIEGKVVMDVGCGTFFSIFYAQAGAKRVRCLEL